ncbi:MAG: outer membrane protein OmpA-like peptidoglycan-associated protein [Oceanicoccus sp.]|jgi:outer membrane protein OmpA-like peptidoglycan-associated protein
MPSIKSPLLLAGLAIVIIVITGCTTNPYTGEKQASKAAVYGAGAAVICGIIGSRDSSKNARNAALGCGAIGAGIGAYMDVQESKLREQLAGTGVSIRREGENIRLIMPGSITFETDKHALRQSFSPVLESVGLVLAKYADTTLRVTGHTDSTGGEQYNQELSELRAQSVAANLQTHGVMRERLYAEGAGENQPSADNKTAEGRASNRRVELYILPKAQ